MTRCAQIALIALGLLAPAVVAAQVPATPWDLAVRREAQVMIGRVRGPTALPRQISGAAPATRPDTALRAAETMLRDREVQLRFCYTEFGLRAAPTLSGAATVTFHVNARRTTDSVAVRPLSDSWQGSAAEQVARCLRQKLRGWRWPEGLAPGRYDVPLAFAGDTVP